MAGGPRIDGETEAKADDADYKALRFVVAGVMSAYTVYVSAPSANI